LGANKNIQLGAGGNIQFGSGSASYIQSQLGWSATEAFTPPKVLTNISQRILIFSNLQVWLPHQICVGYSPSKSVFRLTNVIEFFHLFQAACSIVLLQMK
jgi:hypothetical protein